MSINDKFSKDGNSPVLAEQYKDFGIGQFQEMLPLTEEQVETVTPGMTVKQIREMKPKIEKPKNEIATSQPERVSGEVVLQEEKLSLKREVVRTECIYDKSLDCNISNTKDVAKDIGIDCKGLCCCSCQENCGARCNYSSHERSKKDECVVKIHETVIKTKSTARQHLKDEVRREEDILEQMRDYWMESKPDTLFKHETMLSAYKFMLNDMDHQEQELVSEEQPELSILKNNDQRKDFIENYETWPLWLISELTQERFYRYVFDNGNAFIVKEVLKHPYIDWKIGYSKESKWTKQQCYILKSGKLFKECEANVSELIEYLKEFQKGAK